MRKVLGYILSPIHYLAFGMLLGIFQPVQWVCFRYFGYRAHKASVDFLNMWLVATYYFLGNTVKFSNAYKLPLGRPIIFIANHQSLYDIPPLIYFLRRYHAKFISKIELTKNIPSISYNLKVGGGANINRKDPRQSITEILKLAARMKDNNWSAVIFPEGTRSKDGQVRSFQAGGIGTILKKCPNALLVPIAISNMWKMTRYGIFPLGTFQNIAFRVLPPIEPGTGTIDELVNQAEASIKTALKQ
jgi:1-acyl-sn-glycerol-3-phosphate acyltransferase